MIKIIDKRGSRKTYRLLLLAKETKGIVVCKDAEAMAHKMQGYGITGVDLISYENFSFTYDYGKPVYIDDLDGFLKHKIKDVKGFSLSSD